LHESSKQYEPAKQLMRSWAHTAAPATTEHEVVVQFCSWQKDDCTHSSLRQVMGLQGSGEVQLTGDESKKPVEGLQMFITQETCGVVRGVDEHRPVRGLHESMMQAFPELHWYAGICLLSTYWQNAEVPSVELSTQWPMRHRSPPGGELQVRLSFLQAEHEMFL
jgi:hypothetical protein